MRVICDVEANGLTPDKIWVVVCKDVDTGEVYVFKDFSVDGLADFGRFVHSVSTWIGHNFIGYDLRVLASVLGIVVDWRTVVDTLVVSRTTDATLDRHSIEAWGQRLGKTKAHADIADWSQFSEDMVERCISDVEINYLLFKHLERFIVSEQWKSALETEHFIAYYCSILHDNGFAFDLDKALALKGEIEAEVATIEAYLLEAFEPKVSFVREVTPKLTKFGTIAKNSIPKSLGPDLTDFSADAPFSLIRYVPFNARSHLQRLERLWEAGWTPVNKSDTHRDTEKALRALKRQRGYSATRKSEIAALEARLGEYGVSGYGRTGWKTTDEENLATLPADAPPQFQKLVRFVLLVNRVSTLNTWLEAYNDRTGRIHGSFNHIEPWTQRLSHVRPNMGNIPKFDAKQPEKTPYSDRMRALWIAARDRYLVGVDAESIQLRILGHYINDDKFITALVSGKKEEGNDPHSLNQKALGAICKSRDAAKTFIYAWLLGAGIAKVAAILGCSRDEAQIANDNFLNFYPGLKLLREKVIPEDAARGYFRGFDGRYVRIWGDDVNSRSHFCLAGYLQNGEAVIMKRAVQLWYPRLVREKVPFWCVNFVHDEWQTETIRDMEVATYVAETQADAIRQVGVDLGLNCPMAGSILNGHGKVAIGDNWMETH